MLQHLMYAINLDKSDLIPVLGTETEGEKFFVSGRALEIDEARKLAYFFHVDISFFL